MEKSIIVLRYCILLLSIMLVSVISIEAVENCCGLYSPGNDFDCGPHENNPNRYGNCTWYARYKMPDVEGICTLNAVNWYNQAQAGGLPVGQIPKVGSIAVFNWYDSNNNNLGHLAYVEQVNDDGSFYVTEMGWNTWDCVHTPTNAYNSNSFDGLIGFIYPINFPAPPKNLRID